MKRLQYAGIAVLAAVVAASLLIPSISAGTPRRVWAALPLLQTGDGNACRAEDRAWIEFEVPLAADAQPFTPGQVLSVSDGTVALLIVVVEVGPEGGVTAFDFASSVRISAIVLDTGDAIDLRRFEPPVRNGSGLRAPGAGELDRVSFCYTINLPAPPEPARPDATADAGQPEPTATGAPPSPTPTALTLDLSGQQTAAALATEVAGTATAAADQAATRIAEAETAAADLAATATAQAEALATAEAEAEAARATVAALEATVAAPTPTTTPEPTPTPVPERVVYVTGDDAPFTEWRAPDGWDLDGEVASTDGEGARDWVVLPAPQGMGADHAVEIEFRVTGGELCPRNFGIGLRGSEEGFFAAGIEWACDPAVVLWAGGEEVERRPLPAGVELTEGWHTLRIAAVDSRITVAIDGTQVIAREDPRFPAGRVVALWSDRVALEIRAAEIVEIGS